MALNQVMFTCTALKGTGKAGKLTPDKDGYYDVPLGALNVFNSGQEYYPYEESKKLFDKSGLLQRRIEKGVLRGELGHPKLVPGMSMAQFIDRCAHIWEQCWCFHIRSVWLDHESMKDANGKPIVGIMGKVRGCGPFKSTFDEAMANGMENACFSIRSFTDDYVRAGMVQKVIKEIVTWDFVNECGIATATKYDAPTLESKSLIIQKSELDRAFSGQTVGLGMESGAMDLSGLYDLMGWNKPKAADTWAASWK
jgi:hypothetical protein